MGWSLPNGLNEADCPLMIGRKVPLNGNKGSTSDIARCDAAHYRQFDAIIDPETSRSLSAAFTFARQPDLMDDMLPAGKGRDTHLLDIEPDAV